MWDRPSHQGRGGATIAMPTADLGHWPTVYQLVWALNRKTLGRRTLVARTGITESTVRTHLNKLRRAGLVKMAKAGTSLTAQGLEAFSALWAGVRWVGALPLEPSTSALALDRHNAAALVAGAADKLKESWRYRDAAVREGATGALLLIKRPEGWAFGDEPHPQPLTLGARYPEDAAHVERALSEAGARPQPGDALLVAFGPDPQAARAGLWRVIVELFPPSTETEPHKGG